jgi:hypothetical protein
MNVKIRALLLEAYRRNEMADAHEKAKPILDRWLGLGTAAAYRPALEAGLMRFHGCTPPPRCMGWLCLTQTGLDAMQSQQKDFSERLAYRKQKAANSRQGYLDSYQLAGGLTR